MLMHSIKMTIHLLLKKKKKKKQQQQQQQIDDYPSATIYNIY